MSLFLSKALRKWTSLAKEVELNAVEVNVQADEDTQVPSRCLESFDTETHPSW